MVEEDVTRNIYAAAAQNDVKRLHELYKTFPVQFDRLCGNDLLNVAHEAKSHETVLYLILNHHCLMPVSAALEIDRELMGEPYAQLHRTLEVFANSAAWKYEPSCGNHYSGIYCTHVEKLARQASNHDMETDALHPYVMQAAVDGTLQQWFLFLHECEEKGGFSIRRHSGNMLKALEENHYYFASAAPRESLPMHLHSIEPARDTKEAAQTPARR